ncbi:ABC transporter permease, partial [Methanomethylovorans sp.]|uniref:ABC transporter permease n=1 Tax=Methanomethylovorans sp. TaxID=2758717 RepID=UPI003D140746
MKTSGYLKMALSILYHSKIRSWLTIIGIVIGIASVVTIISISDSMTADMEERMSEFDLTIITITPGYSKASSVMGPPGMGGGSSTDAELTKKDIRDIKLISNISYIDGRISGGDEEVYFMGESASLSINGVDSQVWQYMSTYELESGRMLDPADNNVAVIGYSVAHEVFDNQISVNRIVKINEKSVRVVGILEDGEDDNAIYMPIDAAVDIIEDAENEVYDSIVVQVNDVNNVETAKEEIE